MLLPALLAHLWEVPLRAGRLGLMRGSSGDPLSNSPPLPFSAVAISASHLIVPSIFASFFVRVLKEIALSEEGTRDSRALAGGTLRWLYPTPYLPPVAPPWPPFLSPEPSAPRNLAFWRGLFSSWLNIKDLKAIYRQCGFATNLGQDAALFPQFTA